MAGSDYYFITSQFMTWVIGSLLTFQLERQVFLREQANKLYSPYAYFLAKNVVELPVSILAPLAQMLIIYWGMGLVHFFQVFLIIVLTIQTAMGIGLLISATAPNIQSATALQSAITMPMNLFAGFVANTKSMPKWFSWIQWLSPIRYANEALAHSQFDDVTKQRFHKDIPAEFMIEQGYTLGFWNCILALIAYMLLWRLLSIIVLRVKIDKVQ